MSSLQTSPTDTQRHTHTHRERERERERNRDIDIEKEKARQETQRKKQKGERQRESNTGFSVKCLIPNLFLVKLVWVHYVWVPIKDFMCKSVSKAVQP
jgi:hypothetical protein